MAKTSTVAAAAFFIAIAAVCFSALVEAADDKLVVDGRVYCDTCRVKFETKLSEAIEGAEVKLVCRDRDTEETQLEMKATTDSSGQYKFEVEGDHADEICEVHLVKSPKDDCSEISKGWNSARILLTKDVGVVDSVRHANAIGFLKKEAVKECGDVLEALGFPNV